MIAGMVTKRKKTKPRAVKPKVQVAPVYLYIEEWMREKGLGDEEVGGRIGKSRVTVWRWHAEQHRLNPQKIALLAAAIGCAPEDFWHPPGRPSLDAIVKDASDAVVKAAADMVNILVRTDAGRQSELPNQKQREGHSLDTPS